MASKIGVAPAATTESKVRRMSGTLIANWNQPERREPNSSVADVLSCYRVLDDLERHLGSPA